MTNEPHSDAQDIQPAPQDATPQPSAFEAQGYPRQQAAPLPPTVEHQQQGDNTHYATQSLTVESVSVDASREGEMPPGGGFSEASQPFQKVTYSQVKLGGGSGLAIASLIIGVISLLLSWVPILNVIFIAAGIAGVVLGIVSLAKGEPAKAAAVTGLIISFLAILVALGINFFVAWLGARLWGLVF